MSVDERIIKRKNYLEKEGKLCGECPQLSFSKTNCTELPHCNVYNKDIYEKPECGVEMLVAIKAHEYELFSRFPECIEQKTKEKEIKKNTRIKNTNNMFSEANEPR